MLSERPDQRIRIIGHTDDIGSDWSNQKLSEGRSEAIRRVMIQRGIDGSRIETKGRGERDPIVPNDSEEHRQKNRRVEIIIRKNKHKNLSKKNMEKILKEARKNLKKGVEVKNSNEGVMKEDRELLKNVIDMSDRYESETERLNSLNEFDYMHDGEKPEFLKKK